MNEGPKIVHIAALIGDQARAAMLTALMGGKALTATELANSANVTKQTASAHLAKLADAGLVVMQAQGRHRYFQLAAADVAQLLETLMGVAQRTGAVGVRPGPRDPALRRARVCYDHLAGELGVELYDALLHQGGIEVSSNANDLLQLTAAGRQLFIELGIELAPLERARRPLCRSCLDWSVRRHHLAGGLGAALLNYCYRRKWARRLAGSRIVKFSPQGEHALRQALNIV